MQKKLQEAKDAMETAFKGYHDSIEVIHLIDSDLKVLEQEEAAIRKMDYRDITEDTVQRLILINTQQELLPFTKQKEERDLKKIENDLHLSISGCVEILEIMITRYKESVMKRMSASLIEEGVDEEEALKIIEQSKRLKGLQHLLGPTLFRLAQFNNDFSNSDQSRKGLLPLIEEGLREEPNFDKLVLFE